MRLLHTGDLHLDSAFCAYGQRGAEQQREAGRDLLRRIFECAESERCDMILIAGDLFDGRFVTPATEELFCELVENANIPVVLSPGNHDWYTDGGIYSRLSAKLSDKLILFSSSELQMFELDALRVRVFGYAFGSAVLSHSPLSEANIPADNGYLKIFCGHADLSSPVSRYAPLTLGEIERCGFDYAALGHIHNRGEQEDARGRVRYCGFCEGRSFDEIGEGGVWIVDLSDGECRAERRILAQKSFYICETDISSCADTNAIVDVLRAEATRYADIAGAHLRIYLCGRASEGAISYVLSRADAIAKSAGIAYLELVDETLPQMDGDYLERDTTLRGELYRTLLPKLTSENADERRLASRALRIGLAAIDGRSVFGADERDGGEV
jgi:DNA repair exonuclease SbcCD nuclease subunit